MTRALQVLALLGWLLAWAAPALGAHPFYERLLRDGVSALEMGDADSAVRNLELAAFGFLDEPPLLARALVHLGAAQWELGRDEEFRATLDRLVEIEERFGGYRQGEISPALRADLERRILASATRELEAQRPGAARRRAEALLTLAPDMEEARCLRGRSAVLAGQCDDAVADVAACDGTPGDPTLLQRLLACHVERGEWQEARRIAAILPPKLRQDPEVSPLLEQVAAAPEPTSGEVPAPLPPTEPEPLTDEERAEALIQARELLDAARTVGDLDVALELAARVANADPDDVEAQLLAGEIAYRASRWEDAVRYLERAGDLKNTRPEVLFFFAVSLYETNRQEQARAALERALPDLARTPFVNRYVDKILSRKM